MTSATQDSPLFYRLDTDQHVQPMPLEDLYGGPQASTCWLIGGGPSLCELPCEEIARSPIPKMTINLSGTGLLRPNFWTSYDPTARFHRSIYLDPGILKFVHRRRSMDLVPETTFKVCECPGVIFFDRHDGRDFSTFLSPNAPGIIDWADSMVQAIDLLYRLGFRKIYLAGCELRVRPPAELWQQALERKIPVEPWGLLGEFFKACETHGLWSEETAATKDLAIYHFDESKSLRAAVQTDQHYYRITQCLRLARRNLTQHGLQLISVTPESRLNDYFPYQPVAEVLDEMRLRVGDAGQEPTRGLYSQQASRAPALLGPMRDVKPPNWSAAPSPLKPGKPDDAPQLLVEAEGWIAAGHRFQDAYRTPQEVG
ncbi:hypothetical protein GC163_07830 [bacterium]|nr:hypothetical protein [bacterium]